MSENCVLLQVDDSYGGAVSGFLKFKEQFRGRPGSEFLVEEPCS